jgi:hypothetical protein
MSSQHPRPYTLKDTAVLLQWLYEMHSRAMKERDFKNAKATALLIHEISCNSSSKLDPSKYPSRP